MHRENIRRLCYDLYKLDWKQQHEITPDVEAYYLKDYYFGLCDSSKEYSFSEYLDEFGYNGECYADFEEFFNNEYRDHEYVKRILDNSILYNIYEKDIRELSV